MPKVSHKNATPKRQPPRLQQVDGLPVAPAKASGAATGFIRRPQVANQRVPTNFTGKTLMISYDIIHLCWYKLFGFKCFCWFFHPIWRPPIWPLVGFGFYGCFKHLFSEGAFISCWSFFAGPKAKVSTGTSWSDRNYWPSSQGQKWVKDGKGRSSKGMIWISFTGTSCF